MGFEKNIIKKLFENRPEQGRIKNIELVANRLREKYKYEELDSFVTYLESMEKFFVEAEPRHENGAQLKKEMIETEMYLMSETLGIERRVLEGVYGQFQSLSTTLQDVNDIANKLLEMYPEQEVRIFIEYLREITILFLGYHEEKVFSSEELRAIIDRATEAKMKILSASGTPAMEKLLEVKSAFFFEIAK